MIFYNKLRRVNDADEAVCDKGCEDSEVCHMKRADCVLQSIKLLSPVAPRDVLKCVREKLMSSTDCASEKRK